MIRMIDIAKEAGVSRSLVSAVLSGSGKGKIRVSKETANRIRVIANSHHFLPNLGAQALAGKKSMKIGVLIDSQAPRCVYRILWALEELANESGYSLMIGQTHDDSRRLVQSYEHFMQHGIAGVICLSYNYMGQKDFLRSYFEKKKNLVYYDPPGWESSYVQIDREAGISEAMEHLQKQGRQRIGLWLPGGMEYFSVQQRIRAYRAHNRGNDYVCDLSLEKGYYDLICRWKLDAVLAANDLMAARLSSCLLSHGVRIPDDIAVIGHDNEEFSSFYFPSLSTIDQADSQVGKNLFQLFRRQIAGDFTAGTFTVKTRLIVRNSSLSM